ncbi:MAG: nucleoside kinase [Dehalobacterium sp.]|jgi:uridine kinase
MTDMIQVSFVSGKTRLYEKGTSLMDIGREFATAFKTPIVAAAINNDLKDLSTRLEQDSTVEFFDLTSQLGNKVYQYSLIYLMVIAAQDLFPTGQVTVEHSLSKGLYCECHLEYPTTKEDVAALEQRMREIVAEDRPIVKRIIPREKAISLYEEIGDQTKVDLMKQLQRKTVTMYFCGDRYGYHHSTMVPSTGYLKTFELKYYPPGMILRFPLKDAPNQLPTYVEMPKLGKVFQEAKHWAEIVECDYAARLNEFVRKGEINRVILMAEALHEKKIAEIADHIFANKNRLRIIMVAGPTSSGKTTFIQRLSIQLKVLGISTIRMSIDDYFIDREKLAETIDDPDFESLDVVDVDLLNDHVNRLMKGEEIELPRFDFPTGKQVPSGQKVRIDKRQLLIIEGLHGLNEQLTISVPKQHKVKIYISPLTPIAIDQHSRTPSTDTRLIRRIVRDTQFRGHDPSHTLRVWPSVQLGENKNIFPYSEEADIMFNSVLIYEPAVFRTFATPHLKTIGPDKPEYSQARRLIRLLSFFDPVEDAEIPLNSILREFIGKSCFY